MPDTAGSKAAEKRIYTRSKHYVTITLDGDYAASGRVECEGVAAAFCRLSCPHGCESWIDDPAWPCGPEEAPHTLAPNDYCNVVESIEGSGVLDCHVGRDVVPGPRALIEVEWDEGYLWHFASPEAGAGGVIVTEHDRAYDAGSEAALLLARRVTLRFAWYDLWIGAYVDRPNRTLYVCPLPCVLVTVRRG